MKIKVYSPNGQELKIKYKHKLGDIPKCPLCKHLLLRMTEHKDEESIEYLCYYCLLKYTYYGLRKFIIINGFDTLDKEKVLSEGELY